MGCMREKEAPPVLHRRAIGRVAISHILRFAFRPSLGHDWERIQQIAQSPDCIKQLINVGPKAATRWLLRMIPKGATERQNYYIDERTKDDLMEVISFSAVNTHKQRKYLSSFQNSTRLFLIDTCFNGAE